MKYSILILLLLFCGCNVFGQLDSLKEDRRYLTETYWKVYAVERLIISLEEDETDLIKKREENITIKTLDRYLANIGNGIIFYNKKIEKIEPKPKN